MDAAIALTSAGERRDGNARPTATALRARSRPTALDRQARAEVRAHDGLPARDVAATQLLRRRLLHRLRRVLLLAGGALRQADLRSRRARSARRGIPARLIVTQGGNQPVALLFAGGDGLTIGEPDRPGAAALRRHDRGHAAGRPAVGAHRPLRRRRRRERGALLDRTELRRRLARLGLQGLSRTRARTATTSSPRSARRRAIADTGLANGTTYYYKVSAENANGEGPLSNQASATPSGLVAPVEPLPTVDAFDRANENPLSDAGRWTNGDQRLGRDRPVHDRQPARLLEDNDLHGLAQRRPVRPRRRGLGAPLDASRERTTRCACYARIQQPGTSHLRRLHAAHQPACGNRPDPLRAGRQRRDRQPADRQPGACRRRRLAPARQGLDASRPGATTARPGRAWGRPPTPPMRASAHAGIGMRGTTGRADDFGARTTSAQPDTECADRAPTSRYRGRAEPDRLSWRPRPGVDGGSTVSSAARERAARDSRRSPRHRRRASRHGSERHDRTTLQGVRSERGPTTGPLSNEATRRPRRARRPGGAAPDRRQLRPPNENPLSDAGRWTNGDQRLERDRPVHDRQPLACTKTTTCTSWRNTAQYGPDIEVWARLSTLPGANNQLRLLRSHPAAGNARPTTGTCCAPTSLREPTRSSSSGSTTARSSTC